MVDIATAPRLPDDAGRQAGRLGLAARSRPWLRFAGRRLATFAISLTLLFIGSFMLIHLVPGDPVRASMGLNAPASLVNERRAQLHLDEPIWKQFGYYVRDVAHGDFGTSITTGLSVSFIISARISKTVQLALLAILVVMAIGIPLGVVLGALTSHGRHARVEAGFEATSGALIAVPEFLVATFLVYLLAVRWRILPVAGSESWRSYILPASAIGLTPAIAISRIVRLETLKVMSQEYMLTARSKRLPRRLLYVRHALPNLLTGALTIGGLLFAALLGGTVIVENVFAWPGLGTAAVDAILGRDYPTVQAIVLLLGTFVLVVNTGVDILLALLDPRSVILEA